MWDICGIFILSSSLDFHSCLWMCYKIPQMAHRHVLSAWTSGTLQLQFMLKSSASAYKDIDMCGMWQYMRPSRRRWFTGCGSRLKAAKDRRVERNYELSKKRRYILLHSIFFSYTLARLSTCRFLTASHVRRIWNDWKLPSLEKNKRQILESFWKDFLFPAIWCWLYC